jgi:hypothetical protein
MLYTFLYLIIKILPEFYANFQVKSWYLNLKYYKFKKNYKVLSYDNLPLEMEC